MNWDDLRIFLAVAREGSLSGGARKLGVRHSTVSRRLAALEQKLGVRLRERRKGGYDLTDAGEELKRAAERMEREALEVDGSLGGRDSELRGELRVTAINNMASSVLMPLFASFSSRYPEVDLHVTVSNRYASLPEREADVAIRLTNTPAETLIGRRLVTIGSTVYGGHRYLAELRETGGEPEWLGIECCGFHQSWTREACGDRRQRFFVDDTLLTKAALKQGLGVAYLPCFMGDADPELQRWCEPDPELNLGLWLLVHPDLRRNGRVLAFRDHISREIKPLTELFAGKRPRRGPESGHPPPSTSG